VEITSEAMILSLCVFSIASI